MLGEEKQIQTYHKRVRTPTRCWSTTCTPEDEGHCNVSSSAGKDACDANLTLCEDDTSQTLCILLVPPPSCV